MRLVILLWLSPKLIMLSLLIPVILPPITFGRFLLHEVMSWLAFSNCLNDAVPHIGNLVTNLIIWMSSFPLQTLAWLASYVQLVYNSFRVCIFFIQHPSWNSSPSCPLGKHYYLRSPGAFSSAQMLEENQCMHLTSINPP